MIFCGDQNGKRAVSLYIDRSIDISLCGNNVWLRSKKGRNSVSLLGLSRSIFRNILLGITQMFFKRLVINGIGFRYRVESTFMVVTLCFSHDTSLEIPTDLMLTIGRDLSLTISGSNLSSVGLS
jgi:large subunit ribosomal protein L6